jgi:AraC-like DNA-binding protein
MSQNLPVDCGVTWSIPQLDHLRFMRAQFVEHSFAPHAHDYYVLGIVEDGLQTFTYNPYIRKKELLTTTPGRLIIINPDELHTGEAAIENGFIYRALYPTQALMENIAQEFNLRSTPIPHFTGGVEDDPDLFRRIQRLHHMSEQPTDRLQLEEGLTRFFVDLIRRYARPSFTLHDYQSAHKAVKQVQDYLEAHYAEPIALSDLSAWVHISPYHLARLFRKQVGIPPHKYLENIRIGHAEQLLAVDMPIADVAYATGFSSQSHLTRTFKRFIGTTPGAYLKHSKIV